MASNIQRTFDVFWRFLVLGCISFGGPAAHIGYFRKAFVDTLHWVDEATYAKLVALSQFLPGPGSSQVGFALGLQQAGLLGGIAAFIGFTLPSFLILYSLAVADFDQSHGTFFNGVVQGLKLLAVVVVADASYSMFKSFCRDRISTAIMVGTAVLLIITPSLLGQISALLTAAIIGAVISKPITEPQSEAKLNKLPLLVFMTLLVGLPFTAHLSSVLEVSNTFYQSGSWVFGGGHVVLPLLQQTIGETISTDRFLLGYAAAQAVPGPMFTLSAFLGAEIMPEQAWLGALIATLAIFSPGFLLVLALQNTFESLTSRPRFAGAVWGINAAVVGLLVAALYQPIFVDSVDSPLTMATIIFGFFALRSLTTPIILLVIGFATAGVIIH